MFLLNGFMGISMNRVKRNEDTDVFASCVSALYQTKPN
jgi:hypothetical protein